MTNRLKYLAAYLGYAAILGATGLAQADERVAWKTRQQLVQQLRSPARATWQGTPLREVINGLASSHQVALLLDRRIDPDQPVRFTLAGGALQDELVRLMQTGKLGAALVGDVVYLGPANTTAKLPSLLELKRQQLRKLGQAAARWFRPEQAGWQDLATPRTLLEQVAKDAGIELEGLDQIPHDLWAGVGMPPLSAVDRLTLIAAQYDLTFEVGDGGRTARLVPIPDDVPALKPAFPAASGTPRKVVGTEQKIERLNIQNKRVRDVLNAFRAQFGLELKLDETKLAEPLDKVISFEVKDATLDQALRAFLSKAGLAHRRDKQTVEIFVAEP